MNNRPSLDEMLNDEANHAVEFLKREGELRTMIRIGYLSDGSRLPIATPFSISDGDISKQIALAFVKDILNKNDAWGYTCTSEVWMSVPVEIPPEEDVEAWAERNTIRPSQDPNRIDALYVVAITKQGKKGKMFQIKRDEDGRAIDVAPLKIPGMDEDSEIEMQISGRFAELLD